MLKVWKTSNKYLGVRVHYVNEGADGSEKHNANVRNNGQHLIHLGYFPDAGVPDLDKFLLTIWMRHKL